MRILGLDLGTKTLGIAVSDLTETIASSVTTLRFEENKPETCLSELKKIIDEYGIKMMVIGLPKNMNNTLGSAVDRTRNFISVLNFEFEDIPVYEQDERLSSVTANNVLLLADLSRKKRKKKVDNIAATIILQNYLDIRKGQKNG